MAEFMKSVCKVFFLCVFAAPFLVGCGNPQGFQAKEGFERKEIEEIILPVEAARVERGSISSYFETTTRIEAERSVDVASKASSRCEAIFAEEGDFVKEGEILAELEKAEQRAQYTQNEVQVRQNETAYELAKRQYNEGLGSRIDMDNAQYAYEQSLATLESQKIQLEQLTIRSPIDGVVTSREIQAGTLVSVGQTSFHIVDPASYVLAIAVPEKQLPNLEIGQVAEVTIDALRGRELPARVRRINPSVDPVSGTVRVILDVDESARGALRESAFARVKLVMATRANVLLAPKEAFIEENGRRYVFTLTPRPPVADGAKTAANEPADTPETVSPGAVEASMADPKPAIKEQYIATRVEVKTALEDSRHAQVIFGIEDNALIVTNGQYTLKDGAAVYITTVAESLRERADVDTEAALASAKEKRESGGGSSKKPK